MIEQNCKTTVYEYIRRCNADFMQRIALRYYGRKWTYGQFFTCIDYCAEQLKQMGVGQGTVVTVHLPNCPQEEILFYALSKIGAIAFIVSPLLPSEKLQEAMQRVNSRILFTSESFLRKNRLEGVQVICVRLQNAMGLSEGCLFGLKTKTFFKNTKYTEFSKLLQPCPLQECPDPNSLAFETVCYLMTSGTTGMQNIVVFSNAVINESQRRTALSLPDFSEQNRNFYCAIPLFYCTGIFNSMHLPFTLHFTQILRIKFNIKTVGRELYRDKAMGFSAVPIIFKAIAESPYLPKLKTMEAGICGGDFMPQSVLDKMNQVSGLNCYFTGYGLTESVAIACVNQPLKQKANSVGYPLEGMRIEVIENGVLQPRGIVGELCVQSDAVFSEYFGNPELTAIVKQEHDGEIWVHTGDIGYVDEDGFVFYKNRKRNIIIRKGVNVDPLEITKTLLQADGVLNAFTIGVYDEREGFEKIISFYCGSATEAFLTAYCREHLAANEKPDELILLDAIPMNANGKTDIVRLKEIYTKKEY